MTVCVGWGVEGGGVGHGNVRQTERQADRQEGRQTDAKTDRQAERQTDARADR